MFNMGEYKDQYWTENYKTLYLTSVWGLLEQALMLGFNVILDGTNMSAQKRKNIFGFAGLYEAEVVGYLHSNHKEGLKRRKIDNRDQPDEMWEKVYENFQSQYDEPTLDEGFTEIKIIN
jgi:predicted kinase